jgi:hypothetical protein
MTGLYDFQGVLRFAGRDQADCLAYAALFGLGPDSYSLAALAEAPGSMAQQLKPSRQILP